MAWPHLPRSGSIRAGQAQWRSCSFDYWFVADLADAAEVARNRRDRTARGAAYGLRAKADHIAGTDALDRVFELARETLAVLGGRLFGQAVAIFIAGATCVTSISSGANCARRRALPPTASAPSVLP